MPVRTSRGVLSRAFLATLCLIPATAGAQVLISEFRFRGSAGASDEFIELYNAGVAPVDISDWELRGSNNSGSTSTRATIGAGVTLDPGCFYLIGNSAYSGSVAADLSYGTGITDTGGIGLFDASDLSVDEVGLSVGSAYLEGTPLASLGSTNSDRGYERLPGGASGHATDTDDNSVDFQLADPSTPNNASSACVGGATGPTITINDVSQLEGDGPGTTDFIFTVTLSADATAEFSVTYTLVDGDASGGVDYDNSGSGGTITFTGGDAGSQQIVVPVIGDTDAEGDETFTVVLSDVSAGDAVIGDDTGLGTILNDDIGPTAIHAIQGAGNVSPVADEYALTEGNIVTVVGPDGFAMQTPDADVDGLRATSEGIYVYTGGAPQCDDGGQPRAVQVGDEVSVYGYVVEYFGLTEISFGPGDPQVAPEVTCTDSGLPLPAPVVFEIGGPDGDIPSRDPAALYCGEIAGEQNNFECLEGMYISIPDGIATTGNQRFCGSGQICGDQPSDDAYGPLHIGPHGVRSLREPGVRFGNSLDIGENDAAGVWDGNPEILEMDADRLGAVPVDTEIVGGARFVATGVMAYSFSDYEFWPATLTIDQASNLLPRPVRQRADGAELTIASFNVLRLCNTLDDQPLYECDGSGSGAGGEPSQAELDAKLAQLSSYVADVLALPHVVGVQEVETQAVLQELADTLFNDTGIPYSAYLIDGNDGGGIDNGFLVRADRIIDVSVTQLRGSETWFDPNDGGLATPLHDRPPLLLEGAFTSTAGGAPMRFAVMNNHTKSRGGVDNDNASGQRNRAKRFFQAISIAQEVQAFRDDPENAAVPLILVGDYNDYQFSDGYVDIVGLVAGTYDDAANGCDATLGDSTPVDCNLGGPNLVAPPLLNAVDVLVGLDANESYSFLFTENFGSIQGQSRDVPTSQVLDHILVDGIAEPLLVDAAYGRANIDASLRGVDTGTGPDGAGGTQASLAIGSSDHDGLVVYLDTDCSANPAGDADLDGVCTVVDNCPAVSNADQVDQDGDLVGDACDPDIDGDSVANGDDNCPADANPGQEDFDGDGLGDACDPDIDDDGVANDDDAFPFDPNESADSDSDGIGDNADNCPLVANPGQEDGNGDGVGDACAVAEIAVELGADLAVAPGSDFEVTVNVTSAGPQPAEGASLVLQVPANVQFVGLDTSGSPVCDSGLLGTGGGTISCELGEIAAPDELNLTFRFTALAASSGSELAFDATVATTTGGDTSDDNAGQAFVTVGAGAPNGEIFSDDFEG